MNLALSDEQEFLREAARGALSRFATVEAAREALEQGAGRAARPVVGRPGGRLDRPAGRRGARRRRARGVRRDAGARRVRPRARRRAAARAPARDGAARDASGRSAVRWRSWRRARSGPLPAGLSAERPGRKLDRRPRRGAGRSPAAVGRTAGDGRLEISGRLHFVPDAPGADLYVGVAELDGEAVGCAVEAAARGHGHRGDRLRRDAQLGHVSLAGCQGDAPVGIRERSLAGAWHLAQALIAAESVGTVETALDVLCRSTRRSATRSGARSAPTGRQARLTEVLRQLELSRSLLYYAGWAREGATRRSSRSPRTRPARWPVGRSTPPHGR